MNALFFHRAVRTLDSHIHVFMKYYEHLLMRCKNSRPFLFRVQLTVLVQSREVPAEQSEHLHLVSLIVPFTL